MTEAIKAIILHGNLQARLILAGEFVSICLLTWIYVRFAKKRWKPVLAESLNYHRYHLNIISREKTGAEKNREVAKAMLWTIDKQFPADCRNGLGFKTFLKAYAGHRNTLLIMSDVFYQVARYHYQVEARIPKLMYTLHSTFNRFAIIESVFAPIALIYMDFFLVLSMLGLAKNGKTLLYRDIWRQIRNKKKDN